MSRRSGNMTLKKLLTAGALLAAMSSGAAAANLTIDIQNLRSNDGTVRIALHDGAEGFPRTRAPIEI
jgi:uncharacterized protein (DUF2141 family)